MASNPTSARDSTEGEQTSVVREMRVEQQSQALEADMHRLFRGQPTAMVNRVLAAFVVRREREPERFLLHDLDHMPKVLSSAESMRALPAPAPPTPPLGGAAPTQEGTHEPEDALGPPETIPRSVRALPKKGVLPPGKKQKRKTSGKLHGQVAKVYREVCEHPGANAKFVASKIFRRPEPDRKKQVNQEKRIASSLQYLKNGLRLIRRQEGKPGCFEKA